VVMLRNLSKESLNKQVDIQKSLLKKKLEKSGLDNISTKLNLDSNVEVQIRECIGQLNFIQTVWDTVLPRDVYCKTMGKLIHTMIKEIIAYLINTPDISSNVAQSLLIIFDMITNKVSLLLPEDVRNKMSKYVENWNKFLQLIKVFNSKSPRDIEDSWNNGRGALANEFKAQELKNLIKALIQTSERRNALLDKIN
ncbi:Hypothetical predicted protein, partial [Olea europaea subsp. europaea]